jgi:hypothetical protein
MTVHSGGDSATILNQYLPPLMPLRSGEPTRVCLQCCREHASITSSIRSTRCSTLVSGGRRSCGRGRGVWR